MRAGVDEASSIPSQVGMMAVVDERNDNGMNAIDRGVVLSRKDGKTERISPTEADSNAGVRQESSHAMYCTKECRFQGLR
jgi:hypothetical protein